MFIIAIPSHTPAWVWILLAALLALGIAQSRDRDVTLARVTVLPLVMVGLSLAGVFGAFGPLPVALGGWVVGLAAAIAAAPRLAAVRGAVWQAQTRRLHLPGSWLPLALILGIFLVKYGVGVNLAMQPQLARDPAFAATCSLAYGAFSGLFLGRALPLWALARRAAGLQAA